MLAEEALRDARPSVFWLDDPSTPELCEPLAGEQTADLAVVGGGYEENARMDTLFVNGSVFDGTPADPAGP